MTDPLASGTGIGELNERSLHRALKAHYAVPGSQTEQAIDGYVADIVIDGRIIEIHTGIFWPLKRKLPRLLERHRVTLVHPIARDRYIVKPTADGKGVMSRRMSPKHGSVFAIFAALASIPTLLAHSNLTLEVVITVEEEVRVSDERRNRRRGGWTAVDRHLVEIVQTHRIEHMADLFAMLDAKLPVEFTTADLANTMHSSRRLGQQAAFCFREASLSEICGKDGNALVYRRLPSEWDAENRSPNFRK
ncbi:MAG: hypothetical protein OXL38_00815 [Gammaproteobacteria bacterium]|nr:hypothetical protein [Gammaproteobacteria bacterium]